MCALRFFFSRSTRVPPLPAEVTVIIDSITTPGPGDGRRSGGARSSRLGPPSGPRVPPQIRAGTTAVKHASGAARRAARQAAYKAAEAHHEATLLQQHTLTYLDADETWYWQGSRALCAALDRWCRSPAPADDIDMGTLDQFDFFDDDFRAHHEYDSDGDDSEHDDDFEDESDAPGCAQ